MHSLWQDTVLAIAILGFNIALIPSIASRHKPHLRTAGMTVFFQLAAFAAYVSLSLWYSAAMSFLNAFLWMILVIQKVKGLKTVHRRLRKK